MLKNSLPETRGRKFSFGLLVVGLIVATALLLPLGGRTFNFGRTEAAAGSSPNMAQVPPRPWTAVGSTGVIDEASANLYAFNTTDLSFRLNASGNVVARYNVTNTFDNNANPNKPGWTTLEMGSNAPGNTIAHARLYRVKYCSMEQTLMCEVRNANNDPCAKCTIQQPIDFTGYLYYVEVTLTRPNAQAAPPSMYTLRIY
jgi:hypothetical protein